MFFFDIDRTEYVKKRNRVFIKSITGEQSQLSFIKLLPGEHTNHVHGNEQIGYILSGKVLVTIGKEEKTLEKGMGYYIPANIRHGFTVTSDSPLEYIEIFSPPKQENKTVDRRSFI